MSGYWDLVVVGAIGVAWLTFMIFLMQAPTDDAGQQHTRWADEPGDPTHEQIDQALDLATEDGERS